MKKLDKLRNELELARANLKRFMKRHTKQTDKSEPIFFSPYESGNKLELTLVERKELRTLENTVTECEKKINVELKKKK